MLKNMLFRALLAIAAVSVVTIAPGAAMAQKDDAKASKKKEAAEAAKAKAKEEAKEAAKAKAKEEAKAAEAPAKEKAAEKAQAKAKKTVADNKADAEAEAAAAEAAKKAEMEMNAKNMGQIERLMQIADATNNADLKALVATLKTKEEKRHGMAMPAEAPAEAAK